MKIIKTNRGPRRPYAPPIPESEQLKPKKRALLVGIEYKDAKDWESLSGQHKNVEAMKNLLMTTYEYASKDIVTLVDADDAPPKLMPTRANMFREIDNLVRDAMAGDHFFFYYSGHTDQQENKNNSEEDGLDECIVPCDAESGTIPDNELRRRLVERLPVGSQLIAVFDSCHSESLLDLEHYRCNRVYVPWMSKGRRRSLSLWNRNVRKDEIDIAQFASKKNTPNASKRNSPNASRKNSPQALVRRDGIDPERADVLSRKIAQVKRVSKEKIRSRQSSIEQVLSSDPFSTNNAKNAHFPLKISTSVKQTMLLFKDKELCMSPVSDFPCDGWCKDKEDSEKEQAEIISLSSCKDSQVSWEIGGTPSMTEALVKILERDPHPRLKSLLVNISHSLHDTALRMHEETKSYKKQMREYKKQLKMPKKKKFWKAKGNVPPTPSTPRKTEENNDEGDDDNLEMDNFQDPQIASHTPLGPDQRWMP